MIGIIDYKMGNLGSVSNACRFLGLPSKIVTKPDQLSGCGAMILPGVGAFGDCMENLLRHNFVPAIREWIKAGKPFLGICLGLQLLFEGSEESPGVTGLGVLPGRSLKFQLPAELKVPQIGWNRVRQKRADCPLFKDVPDQSYVYFVHSFYAPPSEADAGITTYGIEYPSVVWRDNFMAVQFHPEKSQKVGLKMLENFGQWAASQ